MTPTTTRPDDTPVEARLRTMLRAAAPADTHVDEGLADLRERLDGATVVSLAPLGDRRRRPLLVAAVIVLVIGAVGAAAVLGAREDEPTTSTATGPYVDGVTGWYVPVGFGDDWAVESVDLDRRDVEGFGGTCPCPRITWVSGDGTQLLTLGSAVNAERVATPGYLRGSETVDLGAVDGVAGVVADDRYAVTWAQDGRHYVLAGLGLSKAGVLAPATALVGAASNARTSTVASPPGFRRLSFATVPGGYRTFPAITVTLRNAAKGVRVAYTLTPHGFGDDFTGLAVPVSVPGPGGGAGVLRIDPPQSEPGPAMPFFTGSWRGADVVIGEDTNGRSGQDVPDAGDIWLLTASLRPATATEWRAFAASAERTTGGDVDVARIIDLAQPGEASD